MTTLEHDDTHPYPKYDKGPVLGCTIVTYVWQRCTSDAWRIHIPIYEEYIVVERLAKSRHEVKCLKSGSHTTMDGMALCKSAPLNRMRS